MHVNHSALEILLVSSDGSSSPILIKAIQITAWRLAYRWARWA